MKPTRGIVEIFGRCFRGINKIALCTEDRFFSRLCIKESDKLLSEFVFFLKEIGDGNAGKHSQVTQRKYHVARTGILQHQNVAKSDDIVQQKFYVAQCRSRLISQIKNVLKLLEILKHLNLAKPATSLLLEKDLLLLEKDLLLLELAILNASRPVEISSNKAGKPAVPRPAKNPRPSLLAQSHKEIAEFIKSKEQVQNLEVFSRFARVSRRTMKRKLSELIRANAIKRFTKGREVFYSIPEIQRR